MLFQRLRIPLLLLLVAVLIVTAIPTHTQAQTETTLRYMAYYGGGDAGQWDFDNITRFDAAHTDISVERESFNIYTQIVPLRHFSRQMNANFDVFTTLIGGGMLQNYIEDGQIADITDLWEEMGWFDQYPQSVIDMASYNGRQYFVPMAFQWNPVFYRADIFDDVGIAPPQTWDELLETCQTLTDNGYVPFTVAITDWNAPVLRWFTVLNLRLNGAEFHNALMRGEESYLDDRVRAVFEHWQEAFDHNCFSPTKDSISYGGAVDQIKNGDAAMYMLGEWLYESTDDATEELLDFFSFPLINPDIPRDELVHYYGAFLHANSQNPEAALELLRYLGGPESQLSNVVDGHRAVATSAIERSLMPDYQLRGIEFLENAHQIVPLMEVSNLNNNMANRALNLISTFYVDLGEQDRIDFVLQGLEAERLEQVGGE
jgi:ABC-type glycerol-3-phosphate transport system substrate-binding protein